MPRSILFALGFSLSCLLLGCSRPLAFFPTPSQQALEAIQQEAPSDPNEELGANLRAFHMALEMYAVDHAGNYPAAETALKALTHQGTYYMANDQMPPNPFSTYELHQSNAIRLPASNSPLKPATATTPTPKGTRLGPGKVPHNSLHDVTTFGAIVYDYDPARASYVIYGIGKQGDDAVVTYVITR
ncbi:hypothetical protein J7643_06350 [bacterium]|nr:hypothetical protein [bacterium]